MAWSTSASFAVTFLQQVSGTTYNLSSDSCKIALYNNSITPDKTVGTAVLSRYNGAASQWITANEQTSPTPWPAGGVALASQTWTQASNVNTFTAANTSSGAAATLSNVYGGLVYDVTQASNGLAFLYFGGANSVTAGVFSVIYNASGIMTVTT
jgi:hypothetical protein